MGRAEIPWDDEKAVPGTCFACGADITQMEYAGQEWTQHKCDRKPYTPDKEKVDYVNNPPQTPGPR